MEGVGNGSLESLLNWLFGVKNEQYLVVETKSLKFEKNLTKLNCSVV